MEKILFIKNFNFIIPELFLISTALFLLVYGVVKNNKDTLTVNIISLSSLIISMFLLYLYSMRDFVIFNGMFISNKYIFMGKLLVIFTVLLAQVAYIGFIEQRSKIFKFEYPILVLLSTSGMMFMISANDLLTLYLSLELQSLPLYILASFHRDNKKSTEAGLKYFILGALSSGLLLFGISLIYGFTGTIYFEQLSLFLINNPTPPIAIIIGLVLMGVALCFKISAVPFHMWAPDVYEGAPTPVTALFSVGPKIAALILLFRLLNQPFAQLSDQWSQFISFMAAASMILGSIAALQQTNIKRLLAYSSISHIGYLLLAVLVGTKDSYMMMLFYFSIYAFAVIGVFASVMILGKDNSLLNPDTTRLENISDFTGLATRFPMLSIMLAIFMLSLAGIPPLAGFFAKFYLFSQAISAKLYVLTTIAVLSSVISAFYYLKIIKMMYFDKGSDAMHIIKSSALIFLILICAIVNIAFIFIAKDWFNLFNLL